MTIRQMKKEDKIAVTIRLSRAIKIQLDQIVSLTRRTRGGYIELALQDRFLKDLK